MHGVVRAGCLLAGRYRLDSPIGCGAMGIVWRGRDELLERAVAVKEVRVPAVLTPDDAEIVFQRTLREAKTAARLNHPGVATVFDVFEEDGSPWIVMELVQARALDQVITEDGPLRPLAAARVGECLLSALACAHAAGVLHRDVKPSNVLLSPDGRAILTDFGIATFEGDPGLTQAGMVIGTPGFTAPERIRGRPATPAADLWSLGATLYAAVEGRGPYERAGGPVAVMAGIVNEAAPRAPSAGPLMPVIDALLRADPAARPDAETAAGLLAGAAAGAQSRGTLPGYPWPYGAAGDAGQPEREATTAVCPIPPGPAGMPPGQRGDLTGRDGMLSGPDGILPGPDGMLPGLDGMLPRLDGMLPGPEGPDGSPAGLADLPDSASLPDSAGLPAFLDMPAFPGGPAFPELPDFPAGPAFLAGPAFPAGPAFLDMPAFPGGPAFPELPDFPAGPAFLDMPAFPGGPAFPELPDFPAGPAFAAGPQFADQPAPPPPGPRIPVRPLSPQPRNRPGRALAAALAAIVVLAAGLLGGLAYARSVGGQPTAQTGSGLRQGTSSHAAGQAQVTAGHGSASSPASADPGPASPGAARADTTRAGRAGAGPAGTGSASPTAAASPGPAASKPATALPAGYRWYTVSAASGGAAAGFTVAVPSGWQASRQGLITYLTSLSGGMRAEINLTPFIRADPVREARLPRRQAVRQGQYPGYAGSIVPGTFHGAADAMWRFGWRQGAGRISVSDLLVSLATSGGRQPYAISMSAPRPGAPAARAIFREMLQTFRPAP